MSAQLSITLFLLAVDGALFALPFWVKEFTKNNVVNLLLRRGCWAVSFYLMSLTSAIMAQMATTAAIGINDELFMYMWLFGQAGYLMTVFMVLSMLFGMVRLFRENKRNERFGMGVGNGLRR